MRTALHFSSSHSFMNPYSTSSIAMSQLNLIALSLVLVIATSHVFAAPANGDSE